jgi:hypothetical protein
MFNIRRQKHDWLVTAGIVVVLVSLYGTMIFEQRTRIREEALMYELLSLRYAVTIFNFTNGRNPENLQELLEKGFVDFKGNPKKYIPQNIAARKGLVDPFGNPYSYDKEGGWIRTSTEEYNWW